MKISIERENLLAALKLVKPAIAKSGAILSTYMTKIETRNGHVVFTANNYSLAIEVAVSGKVEGEGSICATHKTLSQLAESSPAGTLKLSGTADSSDLRVEGLAFNAKVRGMFAEDFVKTPERPTGQGFVLDSAQFKRALQRVLPAVATDEGRMALTGVSMTLTAEKVHLVGTDGFRLAQTTMMLGDPLVMPEGQEQVQVLVPSNALAALVGMLSGQEPVVWHLLPNQSLCAFEVGALRLSCTLIQEPYPDWRAVVPQSFSGTAVVPVEETMQAVKTCRIFACDESSMVRLTFADETMTVSAAGQEVGQNECALQVKLVGDCGFPMSVNSKFLLDALAGVGEEMASLNLGQGYAPSIISFADWQSRTGDSYSSVVMPLYIKKPEATAEEPDVEEAPVTDEPETTVEEPDVEATVPTTEELEVTADEPEVEEAPVTDEPEATADEPDAEEAPATEEPEATAEEPKGTRKPRRSPRKPKGKKVTA